MNQRRLGIVWEQIACERLKAEGFEILTTNYYTRFGEIDIVAKDKDTLVFLEVKYRSGSKCGGADYAIPAKKQQTIRKVAQFYLAEHRLSMETLMRFDAVLITGDEFRHIRNAW